MGGKWPVRPRDHLKSPSSRVQACFIKADLLLNLSILHASDDCATIFKFIELLAEDIHLAGGLPIATPAKEGQSELPELPLVPQDPQEKLPSPLAYGHLFYLSHKKLEALKKDTAPTKAMLSREPMFPPTSQQKTSSRSSSGSIQWNRKP
ncbi:hypothetical protein ACJZ2D_014005 [Fusarium nematophilum]